MMNDSYTETAARVARHDDLIDEINRERAARRRRGCGMPARPRPSWCRGVADALVILLLAWIVGHGCFLCVQFVLSLIF